MIGLALLGMARGLLYTPVVREFLRFVCSKQAQEIAGETEISLSMGHWGARVRARRLTAGGTSGEQRALTVFPAAKLSPAAVPDLRISAIPSDSYMMWRRSDDFSKAKRPVNPSG